jgi:hypothetical protein
MWSTRDRSRTGVHTSAHRAVCNKAVNHQSTSDYPRLIPDSKRKRENLTPEVSAYKPIAPSRIYLWVLAARWKHPADP